jgi:hypothetical protein
MKKVIEARVDYQLLIKTPPHVTELDVLRQLETCHWDFEIELAMYAAGVVKAVETPQAEQRGPDETVWACICDFAVSLTPWEPLPENHYNPDDTFPLFSATPSLPDNWEVVERSLLYY